MKKWIVALGALVALAALVVWAAPSLMLRYPSLLGLLGRITDPIGPHREVVWDVGPGVPAAPPDERPPNIVVILVDDLGWNDLTWGGGGIANGAVRTPNIDAIARDGVQFTAGYAGNATCAPSRAAIMTGRYPPRFGFESTPAPPALGYFATEVSNRNRADGEPEVLFHEQLLDQVPSMNSQGVPSEEITIAELLQGSGYHTVGLGKWHLGASEGKRPHEQGFDEFLGFYSGGQLFAARDDPDVVNSMQEFDPIDQFLWKVLPFAVRKNGGPRFTPGGYMTDYLSAEAVRAIEANRHRPFFMYLAYNAPHTPLQATRADYDALAEIEHHATRVYGGMVRSLDRGIGRVLDALRTHDLERNTLVIFSSDNGGAGYLGIPDVNHPYRGWKMTFFEGGLHSPFFMKWPARLPAGKRVNGAVAHIDVFTSAASAAGAPLPADRTIDGVDLLPYAVGDAVGEPHKALFWRSGHYGVVLSDGWKLQASARPEKRWLYDLNVDPTERNNLVESHPARARRLQALLDQHNEELGPPGWPAIVEGPIPVDRTSADPYVPGEEYVYWPN